ncbi:MAG TPA: hypothetical protein VFU14_20390 [Acidimicrobiales bacterium]|nr:hypothetical protein [Acidimicrobiales bacterium]
MAMTDAERMRRHRERLRAGRVVHLSDLAVECWCHATIVHVPRSTILAGSTGSCGAPGCGPPEAA